MLLAISFMVIRQSTRETSKHKLVVVLEMYERVRPGHDISRSNRGRLRFGCSVGDLQVCLSKVY